MGVVVCGTPAITEAYELLGLLLPTVSTSLSSVVIRVNVKGNMELGKVLIVLGGILLTLGLLLVALPKGLNPVSWFGKLPGDISYSKDNVSIFIPLTSMVIVSALMSVSVWLFRWLFPGR